LSDDIKGLSVAFTAPRAAAPLITMPAH